jgi:hypothetical protein
VLALLALPAVAAAGPKPIKKPDAPAKTPTAPSKAPTSATTNTNTNTNTSTSTSQTPIKKPGAGTTTRTDTTANTTKPPADTSPPPASVVVVDVVGRDQRSAEITLPAGTPAIAAPDPTPLARVAAGDRVRAHGSTTPAWKLALLALLAAAEAFLVVRLVRHRPGRGLSTA